MMIKRAHLPILTKYIIMYNFKTTYIISLFGKKLSRNLVIWNEIPSMKFEFCSRALYYCKDVPTKFWSRLWVKYLLLTNTMVAVKNKSRYANADSTFTVRVEWTTLAVIL